MCTHKANDPHKNIPAGDKISLFFSAGMALNSVTGHAFQGDENGKASEETDSCSEDRCIVGCQEGRDASEAERAAGGQMISSAVMSLCGKYRYRLQRRWDDGPNMCFIMLNPSTADAENDDPTIRRCINFAKRELCGGLIVVNLFSLRATNPVDLWATPASLRNGPDSDGHIAKAIGEAHGNLVAAWGAGAVNKDPERIEFVIGLCQQWLMCLGKTAAGQPRHPLYVNGDQPLIPFNR